MMKMFSHHFVILAGILLLGAIVPQHLVSASWIVSACWPPTGLMLGILVLYGWRYLPVLFLGATGAAILMHNPPMVALTLGFENSMEISLCYWLLMKARFDPSLKSLRDFQKLLAVGILSVTIAVFVNNGILLAIGVLHSREFLGNYVHWVMADLLGLMLFTPLLLVWKGASFHRQEIKPIAEAVMVLGLAFLVGQVVFLDWLKESFGLIARGYWMYLFAVWVPIRLGMRGTVLFLLMVSAQAMLGALLGTGFFANDIAKTHLQNYFYYVLILGSVGMSLATHMDERNRAEESVRTLNEVLRRSEAKLLTIFNTSPAPILISTLKEGKYIDVNKAFVDITGFQRSEVIGHSSAEFNVWISDKDRVQFIDELSKKGSLRNFEAKFRMRSGVIKDFLISSDYIEIDNQKCSLNVLTDISERKQTVQALQESENNLRKAQRVAHVGSWVWDIKANHLEWSDEMYHIFGIEKEKFRGILSDVIKQVIHPDDRAAVEQSNASVTEQGKPIPLEYRVIWPDGTVRTVWAEAGEIIVDEAGTPAILTGIVQDITEQRQAEEDRAKLKSQLQQSQKLESLGTLAGGVAHDMNNVLGAILGLASAHIGNQPYGSPLHKALDTICKATERGGKMVKSLLSFARQTPAEINKLDINTILKEEVTLLERTTLAKVRLEMDLEVDLRPILGDASALTHAFMNLCVNAVDAMPENGTLTLHSRNVDNDWIEIVVEDTGTGMPKEVLDKALDPFFTTKGTGKGTGLGLSMVFNTVKAHRGQMEIESELGHGTRVRLRFPVFDKESQATASADSDASLIPHGPMKVLLIDDDDLIQSSGQAILEALGHTTVHTALSGEEALAMLAAGLELDLIILDMNMPGLGGSGTLPRLRRLRPLVPVLLSTGRTDQTALNLASAFPGVTILPKPFGLRELQKHLESIGLG